MSKKGLKKRASSAHQVRERGEKKVVMVEVNSSFRLLLLLSSNANNLRIRKPLALSLPSYPSLSLERIELQATTFPVHQDRRNHLGLDLNHLSSHLSQLSFAATMDDDFAAMMGFAGFGKKAPVKKTAVTTEKLDKTKRAVGVSSVSLRWDQLELRFFLSSFSSEPWVSR